MLLISGNTMAEGVRERTSELAVLKTIGFSDATTLALVLAESVAVALIGCVLGLVCAFTLISVGVLALDGLALTPRIIAEAFGMALLFGILAGGALPAWQASRLHIVQALGRA